MDTTTQCAKHQSHKQDLFSDVTVAFIHLLLFEL